jgi:quercetin dioxygenase-like cupin family protein
LGSNFIELIKEFDLGSKTKSDKDKEINHLFDGAFRKLVEVRLQNGAVLSRHKANEPITVFCLSGAGVFRAGNDLEESQTLRAGTLITLEGGVDHEVVADPALHLLVTKFKDS